MAAGRSSDGETAKGRLIAEAEAIPRSPNPDPFCPRCNPDSRSVVLCRFHERYLRFEGYEFVIVMIGVAIRRT